MIEKIDIKKFGSFNDFVWNSSVKNKDGNSTEFKKLNIIYGRNYSGKTTLSKIFQSLEMNILPEKYDSPDFSIKTDSTIIQQNLIGANDLDVRVYNKDFTDRNLSFLKDDDGKIAPFAIVGSENQEIEKLIEEQIFLLGSEESKRGLIYSLQLKEKEYEEKRKTKNSLEKNLTLKLTNKANLKPNGIKHNSLYKDPNYNVTKICADIDKVISNDEFLFDQESIDFKKTILKEVALPDITLAVSFDSNFRQLEIRTNELIAKKITPTNAIQDLLDDHLLQYWVKNGVLHHKNKRNNCGFCGQPLPSDLWNKLDEHFSKESQQLEEDLLSLKNNLEEELKKDLILCQIEDFYSVHREEYTKLKGEIIESLRDYKKNIKILVSKLVARQGDIFSPQSSSSLTDKSEDISKISVVLNNLISKNNTKTHSLSGDQYRARQELRLNEIATFIADIGYINEQEKISTSATETDLRKDQKQDIIDEIAQSKKVIHDLQAKIKDEKKGAEKVNDLLTHYFGHDSLKLHAQEDSLTSSYKFKILRGDKEAFNLSEGECSLVAFCYFMAKLGDSESEGKQLIVYIDDPISSLDSNHIFFVYSLIEHLIAKPSLGEDNKKIYSYKQLFISTHNLDFLKYLKKISKPRKSKKHMDFEQFLISSKEQGSSIELMPPYLKNYITEFNYLFGEIYICSNADNAGKHHQSFYNFGNNLRKFLEAFLFFKYPFSINENSDHNRIIEKFFKDEPETEPLVQRLVNEFSHLAAMFDRSVQPIDYAEISTLSKFILSKIERNDKDQYDCLLDSIQVTDDVQST